MALARKILAAGAASLMLVLSASCNTVGELPGTALGTFAVTAVLSSNTCGTGLKPSNPWKFDADMSLDGNTLYFRPEDQDEVSAPLDSSNAATFTNVAKSETADSACTLSLKSVYTVELDSDSAPTTASGTLSFEYSASKSNTCKSQLSENGGVYADLPCTVEYSYTALKD